MTYDLLLVPNDNTPASKATRASPTVGNRAPRFQHPATTCGYSMGLTDPDTGVDTTTKPLDPISQTPPSVVSPGPWLSVSIDPSTRHTSCHSTSSSDMSMIRLVYNPPLRVESMVSDGRDPFEPWDWSGVGENPAWPIRMKPAVVGETLV